jgi:hypothetical protein
MKPTLTLLISLSLTLLISCDKKETLASDNLSDYISLEPGKYIRYRLDSTLFINFGQTDTVISYQAKDVVDAEITDNTGRPSFRVIRYLRPLDSQNEQDWSPTLTYIVTPTREVIELVENNLRFQKLRLPITSGFNWHGNSFLPTTPFYDLYQFSNDDDIHEWDYTYENIGEPVAIDNQVFENTITVAQVADSVNVPIEFPEGLAYRNYWVEQYAKDIGLIYREAIMWEYQPPNGGNPGFRSGFGLRMTIIDHN